MNESRQNVTKNNPQMLPLQCIIFPKRYRVPVFSESYEDSKKYFRLFLRFLAYYRAVVTGEESSSEMKSFGGLRQKDKSEKKPIKFKLQRKHIFGFKLMPNPRELSKQLFLFYCYQTRVFDSPANVSDCVSFFFHKARPQKL